jgi:hypothetical protein
VVTSAVVARRKGSYGIDAPYPLPIPVAPIVAHIMQDILATGQYRMRLAQVGMTNVTHRGLGWRIGRSGPWLPTRLVTATKPPLGDS